MPRVVPSQVVSLIDRMYPWAEKQQEGQQGRTRLALNDAAALSAILALIEQIPGELIVLGEDVYSSFVSSVAAIRMSIAMWQARGDVLPLERVRGLPDLHPVSLIRRALSKCPDEFPSVGTPGLSFIPDAELRESLRRDISATNQALAGGEWKSATVLAGSIVEALLLWRLQQDQAKTEETVRALVAQNKLSRNPGPDPEKWYLSDYIEVAGELKIIQDSTANQAKLAKDYRNLIHPGRAIRLGIKCDRATALSAVAAVEHVIRDLMV